MTKEDFLLKIEVLKTFDFVFERKIYRLDCQKDGIIQFMEDNNYDSVMKFNSFTDLMANCKVENRFLREVISSL